MTQGALELGARLVAGLEEFEALPYLDQGRTWTIGFGTTRVRGAPINLHTKPCSRVQATTWLMADLADVATHVDALVPEDASDSQRAACYSFAYNEGWPSFATSTLLHLWLTVGPIATIPEWDKWIYVRVDGKLVPSDGLKARRAKEKAVFFGKETIDATT